MDESLIELFKLLDSQSLEDNREKIRTKIYKDLDKLRKKDYEFFKRLEIEEFYFWFNLLREHKDSNLNNLVNIYECLKNLKYHIDSFKDLVNTD